MRDLDPTLRKMIEKAFPTRSGNIHYWVSGNFDKERRTLVLLPGLTADHRLFDKQIEYLEPLFNLFVWDAPGHASSFPFEPNFSLADKARWLDGILASEGIDRPVIVGQSMGGYVGQVYCELFPDKPAGFVSIDSAPLQRHYMTKAEIWMLKHTEGIYRAYPWKALVRDGANGCAETEYGRKLMADMMHEYDGAPERYVKLVSQGYRMLAEAIEADLRCEIKCPAILICGEKDKAGSAKAYNKKWAKETGLPLYMVPGAGHNSNTDAPDEINRLISGFLGRLKA